MALSWDIGLCALTFNSGAIGIVENVNISFETGVATLQGGWPVSVKDQAYLGRTATITATVRDTSTKTLFSDLVGTSTQVTYHPLAITQGSTTMTFHNVYLDSGSSFSLSAVDFATVTVQFKAVKLEGAALATIS